MNEQVKDGAKRPGSPCLYCRWAKRVASGGAVDAIRRVVTAVREQRPVRASEPLAGAGSP